MTTEEIRARIKKDAEEKRRIERLQAYYRARHAIAERRMSDPSKPNNRLAHGFPKYIASCYTGYLFGEPVTYGSQDEELAAQVKACFEYNDEASENARLGLDLSITGRAVELMYIDGDGMVRFARVDPAGVVAVRDNTIEAGLTALIRYYNVENVVERTVTGMVEVYDEKQVSVYRVEGGIQADIMDLRLEEERPHGFGDVPATVYYNNPDGRGDFEDEISLIDAYDLMQSESLNDQEYFSDAYLKLKGIGEVSDQDVADMKKNRVLLLPDDADAEWLVKAQSDALPENIKSRLNHDIHRFSGVPDMSDQNFAGNLSGVALKYKLLPFENIAGVKEREFKRGLQRRLELLCGIWRVLSGAAWDWRRVKIEFHRSLPENLYELSQVVGNLSDIVSDRTKREILPLQIDEEEEQKRLDEQNEGSLFSPQERKRGEVKADGAGE